MGTSLCIMSGLGGCGKTTLSILISEFLSMNQKKVLLVDCDENTHGATYYFESYLSKNNQIYNTAELLFSKNNIQNNNGVIKITENLSFVPSIKNVKDNANSIQNFNFSNYNYFSSIYDVIIFDCQSGFSRINEIIANISSKKLIVLEANAINASATRMLYYQLIDQMKSGNTYQVFNKIIDDDLDYINDIIFDKNIECLEFIPYEKEYRNTYFSLKFDYNKQNFLIYDRIYNMVNQLFPEYDFNLNKNIESYNTAIKSYVETVSTNIKDNRKNQKKLFWTSAIVIIFSVLIPIFIAIIYQYFFQKNIFTIHDTYEIIIIYSVSILVEFISVFINIYKHSRQSTDNYYKIQNQMDSINMSIKNIENLEISKLKSEKVKNDDKYTLGDYQGIKESTY